MLPVIALIGRPNVGKSTLFNRLTRSRDALVADYPGLTRDRKYGFGKLGPIPYLVIDTGGVAGGEEGIDEAMVDQTIKALREADAAIIINDADLSFGCMGCARTNELVMYMVRQQNGLPVLDIKYPGSEEEGVAFVAQIKEFLTELGDETNE